MADPADDTAAVRAVRPGDTLAPGARLGFGDEPLTLAEVGPRSDEFFLGAADLGPGGAHRPRGCRRRHPSGHRPVTREGKPRRAAAPARDPAAGHVPGVGFILLVAAVPVAAYFVLSGTPTTTGS